jgi:hypothetical protein
VRVCVHRGECMRVYMSACVCTVFQKKKKVTEQACSAQLVNKALVEHDGQDRRTAGTVGLGR